MVCGRCISAVEKIFGDENIALKSVALGEVNTQEKLSKEKIITLSSQLQSQGFELLEDSTAQEIEKVKTHIISIINSMDIAEDFVLSKSLSQLLHRDYSTISKNFSQVENTTLEQYFILQKIEKVKELLSYNEFSLTEIAGKLGYKSVQHLSSQFKMITGFTPSEFKKVKNVHRVALDKI